MSSRDWRDMRPEDLDGYRFTATTRHGATLHGRLAMTGPTVLKDTDALAVTLYRTRDGRMHLNEHLFTHISIEERR